MLAQAAGAQRLIARGPYSGDQASPPVMREIVISPLHNDQQPIFKFHDIKQVDEEPREPGQVAGKLQRVRYPLRRGCGRW